MGGLGRIAPAILIVAAMAATLIGMDGAPAAIPANPAAPGRSPMS